MTLAKVHPVHPRSPPGSPKKKVWAQVFRSLFAIYHFGFSAVPSAPRNLQVVGATTDGAVLAWISPEKDGGSPVMDYITDVRLPNDTKWTTFGSTPQTQFTTPSLPVGKCDFRVSARNAIGVSLPLELDDVRIKQMIRG